MGLKGLKCSFFTVNLEPHQKEARFWYQLWLSGGTPREGELYRNMRIASRNYWTAWRKCSNAAEVIKRDKFVEACLSGDRDMFEELKKIRGSTNTTSTKVDLYRPWILTYSALAIGVEIDAFEDFFPTTFFIFTKNHWAGIQTSPRIHWQVRTRKFIWCRLLTTCAMVIEWFAWNGGGIATIRCNRIGWNLQRYK